MNKKVALFALLGIVNFAPMASAQYIYIIGKDENYVQTGDGVTAADPTKPYRFEATISGSPQDASTPASSNNITTPGGGEGLIPLAFSPDSGQWENKQDFTTQSAFETAFPNGSYTFNSGGSTAGINVTGNLYTNTPMATFSVTNGVWNNGVYSIYAGQDITINTNSIAGFTAGNFRVGIEADAQNNINSYPSIKFDSLDTGLVFANGNITIPGSELTPGTDWQIKLQFNAFSEFNPSGLNGGQNVGIYTAQTVFDVAAVPEPAETALLVGALALGAAQLRRRQQKA